MSTQPIRAHGNVPPCNSVQCRASSSERLGISNITMMNTSLCVAAPSVRIVWRGTLASGCMVRGGG